MKAIIFDMYGVVMKAPEGDLIPFIRKQFPNMTDKYINDLWKEAAYGLKSSHEFFRSIGYPDPLSQIEKEYLDTVEIDEEFIAIANYLKSDYKLVLLSNDISEWSHYLREKFSLNELFDVIVISGDYGFLKPDARLYHIILETLDLPANECCFIDDREKNIEAAEKLGMKVILFNRRNVLYQGNIINSFQELKTYFPTTN